MSAGMSADLTTRDPLEPAPAPPAAATRPQQDALPLTGLRRLFACTPARLAAFDCPRRYRLTYLDRPAPAKGPPWAHNTLGAVVHLALHRWWSLPTGRRTPDQGGWLVERNWTADGFRDSAQSARWRSTARRWVTEYLTTVDPAVEPLGVERTVAARTDHLAVSGRADRIDDRDGELVVVDYKTGRHPPTESDARSSTALALYALATAGVFRRPCRTVELHHVPTGVVARIEHSDAGIARHVGRAEATAADIVAATDTLAGGADGDEVFPARPGPGCGWCDFRRICPPGRTASPQRDPWAGLAED
jgi:putative RecB family exonuclease